MLRRLLIGSALILFSLVGAHSAVVAQPTDPFDRSVSECDGVTLLHRITEDMFWLLDLPAGAYSVALWTPTSDFDPTGLQIKGFGHDGIQERGYPGWNTRSGDDDDFGQYGKYVTALAAPGGTVWYWLAGDVPPYYLLEIFAYDGCQEPSLAQRELPQGAFTVLDPTEAEDNNETERVLSDYEPVIASNHEQTDPVPAVWYESRTDLFTDRVRTDVRMSGPEGDITLDAVCFDSGNAALGFRFLDLTRDENFAESLEVTWRVNDGPVHRRTLTVSYLDTTPAIYFRAQGGFADEWPNVLEGGTLAVRVGYRGVQEDTFDLDVFGSTPVHENLVNCGSY